MKRYYHEEEKRQENFYSDMALERQRADISREGVEYRAYEGVSGIWECVKITSPEGEKSIGRPCGLYDTLNTGRMELMNFDEIEDAKEDVSRKLCELFDSVNVLPERLLVVGLGNPSLTPDSIGPQSASFVTPTLHIKEFDGRMFESLECSEIAVITPNVSANSGMDALYVIKGVSDIIKPTAVIAIDAVATSSVDRLGSTIQFSTTGIFPGSGVGNYKQGITYESIGIPVFSIGVPTVIDARSFCENEKRADGLIVAPKEIDEIASVASKIIGGGINQAFGISPL